jgi:hypothetical protein
LKITIEVIEHHEQRYDTCGDWELDVPNKILNVKVSDLGNWRYNFLVGFHEMIEAALCMEREITTAQVDAFDMQYEEGRDYLDNSEPGDHPDAPYRKEHFFATSLERLMAAELDVDWFKYEEEINKLEY